MGRSKGSNPGSGKESFEVAVRAWAKIGLEERFVAAVEKVLQRLRVNPFLYGKVDRWVRWAQVTKFPYAVLFTVRRKNVKVLAVIYAKRGPHFWRKLRRKWF